jgi:nitric oxide reductase subunit B
MYYAVTYGVWYARSPEITTSPFIRLLNYLRIAPDVVFGAGGVVLFIFILRAIVLSFSRKAAAAQPTRRKAGV